VPWKKRCGRQAGLRLDVLDVAERCGQIFVLAMVVHWVSWSGVSGACWSPDVERARMASCGPSVASPPSYGKGMASCL